MDGQKIPLIGNTLHLKGLIGYQEGSIVSRTLLDKPAGTLTLFAFDGGQGLSEHTAPFDATIFVIDGDATVTIDGVSQRVREGEMIIMPANHPHAVRGDHGPFTMLLIMIRA